MGDKLFENSLKSQMEQQNKFFNHGYNFLSSNFNSLGKIRQGEKKQPLKLNFLNFRKMDNSQFLLCFTSTEPVSPCHIYSHTKFCIFNFYYIKTIERMHFLLSFFMHYTRPRD